MIINETGNVDDTPLENCPLCEGTGENRKHFRHNWPKDLCPCSLHYHLCNEMFSLQANHMVGDGRCNCVEFYKFCNRSLS